MQFSKRIKLVSGTAAVAVALSAGAAVASDDGSTAEDIKLDDTVTIENVKAPSFSGTALVSRQDALAETSPVVLSIDLDSVESVDSVDSAESSD